MNKMQKYFMLTRGRTGSTAILDEMGGLSGVFSVQEIFLKRPAGPIRADLLRDYYRYVLPFDAWRHEPGNAACISDGPPQSAPTAGETRSHGWLVSLLRRFRALSPLNGRLGSAEMDHYVKYLEYAEDAARQSGAENFIFKLLSNNLSERSGLAQVLKDRGYRAFHLVRSNLVRQVLSGMIAKKRGAYNRKNYVGDNTAYIIDLDEFEMLLNVERLRVDEDRRMLKDMSFDFLEISYEEFCENRVTFYTSILSFMGLPIDLPKRTDFSVMIDDLRKLVINYDELETRVVRLGWSGSLVDGNSRTSR